MTCECFGKYVVKRRIQGFKYAALVDLSLKQFWLDMFNFAYDGFKQIVDAGFFYTAFVN